MATSKNSLQELLNTVPKTITPKTLQTTVEKKVIGNGYTRLTILESADPQLDMGTWISENMDMVTAAYDENKNLLFRGFKPLDDKAVFPAIVQQVSGSELLDYTEPSTPRTQVGQKVYTSTEFPNEEYIVQHNEHSYSNHWPLRIFFYCDIPAEQGGQTPVCDSRAVYKLISEPVRKQFEQKNVMYVRNFSEELDISWEHFFQTSDKEKVAEYCKEKHIELEWKGSEELRTRQRSQSVLAHPVSGEKVWFNQAHLFHVTNLRDEVAGFLIDNYGEENLPRNAYYGDGSSIAKETLEEIKAAYSQAMFSFEWKAGDLIMLDNVLYSHGRNPYQGKRSILVAMTDEYPSRKQATATGAIDQKQVSHSRKQTASHYLNKLSSQTDEAVLKYKLALANRMMAAFNLEEGGISGHISLKVPGRENAFWVNPFGMLSEEVTPANLIMVDEQGTVLSGDHPVNVAGFCIHATIHKMYPHIHCIVHTHSPWGTVFSTLDRQLLPLDQNCCMFFGNHALFREYNGPVNDAEDAVKLAQTLNGQSAVILANHGAITCGDNIETAVMYMVALERAFRLNIIAMQTGEYKLIDDDVARMTKEWIANPIGFSIEFEALQRKVERMYPELLNYKPRQ
ncbi:Ribulose-5-phosphate 4-epimerase/Fuculose-1-phosphate aldolase [Chitinophaga eiseniae]|uniref:Ribulose-5-phosphate 4-epimerase/Fuculose-1-phosphate aldolase n=1 Tax=Chitinophaga eiseniae TaxID=634771 RepID=A0A1T4U7R5_9BACT|nr:class II aldolase/adducin family protein [Chitinophaga eiseniae]SKA48551.1 Ribulose-5-phosphate 4-epimerase/Fuculose-1-phosphate aldolase [Chitinophaga eiseniae]